MKRKIQNYTDKIEKLEQQREVLVAKRKDEIFNLFNKYNSLSIDDKLLIGFLLFVTNPDNKHHSILQNFRDLALAKIPRKNSKQDSKSIKET